MNIGIMFGLLSTGYDSKDCEKYACKKLSTIANIAYVTSLVDGNIEVPYKKLNLV